MVETRISIIIPVFNEERYLKRCLNSVKSQTLKPHEVIVVDNNSTDASAEIARNYSFVRVIKEQQQGLVYARTTGLNAASGDLLVRLDADVRLPKNWIETLQHVAAEYPGAAAFTGRGTFYDTPLPRFLGWVQVVMYQYLQFPAMRGYTLWGANMAVRRDAWDAVKATCHRRNDLDEDIDLTFQLHHKGYRVKYTPKLAAAMSLRRDQTSPKQVLRYVATWPLDYVVNGRWVAAAYIVFLTAVVMLSSALLWLCLLPFGGKKT
jgi:glycosyltransferase involved in cell wall biosynthesis